MQIKASSPHFGHGAATAASTGRVKCLMCPQLVHVHESDLCSARCSTSLRAESAWSRIDLSAAISASCAESISSTPTVEACRLVCAIFASKDAVDMLSCSGEHIKPKRVSQDTGES
jgi:hypothetical protein